MAAAVANEGVEEDNMSSFSDNEMRLCEGGRIASRTDGGGGAGPWNGRGDSEGTPAVRADDTHVGVVTKRRREVDTGRGAKDRRVCVGIDDKGRVGVMKAAMVFLVFFGFGFLCLWSSLSSKKDTWAERWAASLVSVWSKYKRRKKVEPEEDCRARV